MSFESTGGKVVQRNTDFHSQGNVRSLRHSHSMSEGWIFRRSRLTEDDLELFMKSIQTEHKRKHYRVLAIAAIILIVLGIVFYLLYF